MPKLTFFTEEMIIIIIIIFWLGIKAVKALIILFVINVVFSAIWFLVI